jgi:hypothetical protein
MMPYLFSGPMVIGGLVYAAIKATDPSVRERSARSRRKRRRSRPAWYLTDNRPSI